MARLLWNQEGQNQYEYGIDRGVFYADNDFGYVWNGLTEVEESSVGGEIQSYYFDGVKFLDITVPRNYQAKISALSIPEPFFEALGERSVIPGLILTRQTRKRFGLSYRTMVESPRSYKIHIVYNVLASWESKGNETIGESVSPAPSSWAINAVPPASSNYRPSAHFIFDSWRMDPNLLRVLEEILYGTNTTDPNLPDMDILFDLVAAWAALIIMPQSTTGLAQLISGMGDLTRTSIAGINRALPKTRLTKTAIDGLYQLES